MAFGDDTFGSASTTPAIGSTSLGGGKRKRKKRRQDKFAGITRNPFEESNPLDTAAGELAFEDNDNLRNSAWGMLNNAGISASSPFGGNAAPWLDNRIATWMDEHRGNLLTNDHDATFENMLYDRIVGSRPDERLQAMDFKDWLQNPVFAEQEEQRKKRQRDLSRFGPVGDAAAWDALKVKQQAQYQQHYDDWAADYKAPAGIMKQPEWIRQHFNPAARSFFGREWEGQTAATRGYNSNEWVAPKRTIQF